MQKTALARPVELLLVEDNAADIRLLQEVLKEVTCPHSYPSYGMGSQP